MKFWIDIVNSPHVHFFKPLMEKLIAQGHDVQVTAREFAQTTSLLDKYKIPFTLIGAHAGPNLTRKIADVFSRAIQLHMFARKYHFDKALTFNSPSMVVAARLLNIPSTVFMDYEYQPLNHLTFRFAHTVVTPVHFPRKSIARFGAMKKTVTYNGLKEQVYLSSYQPNQNFLPSIGIEPKNIIVTVRPPATMALYHRFENTFFYDVVRLLLEHENVFVIAIPRVLEQRQILKSFKSERLMIPDSALDGRDLVYYSDLVISAGGTMTREAAVMGTPAYTVFRGRIGAVDRYLIGLGRIVPIMCKDDVENIRVAKTDKKEVLSNTSVNVTILHYILQA